MYQFYLYHKDLGRRQRIEDPVGWDGLGMSLERDRKWHGVFWEYTPKLRFIKSGKTILSTFYKRYGIEADVYLIIMIKEVNTRKMREYYRGRVNFTTFKLSTLFAECNIENVGFIQKFKNAQEVKVDLTGNRSVADKLVNTFARETIELHSKTIRKVSIQTIRQDSIGETTSINPRTDGRIGFTPPAMELTKDDIPQSYTYLDANYFSDVDGTMQDLKLFAYKFEEPGPVIISTEFNTLIKAQGGVTTIGSDATFSLKIDHVRGSTILETISDSVAVEVEDNEEYHFPKVFSLNHNIDVLPKDELYFYFEAETITASPTSVLLGGIKFELNKNNFFKVSLDSSFPSSMTEVLPIFETFARVTEAITDHKDVFRSNYYIRTDSAPRTGAADGAGSLRGITNGGRIRGISLDKIGMYANFKELMETSQAIDGTGVGIVKEGFKEVVEVEPITHFYQPVEVARFTNIKDIEMEVANDMYYNELEVGYKKWANEESNNLDEFASKRTYTLPITQLQKKLVMISPYIASGYTLEYTRRDRFDLDKDRDEDNDNFIIDMMRSGGGFAPAKDEDFDTLINILDPGTVYNAKLSISRNILRNGAQIAATLYKQEDGTLRISFAEGNKGMVSQLTGEASALTENANITVSQLSKAIWIPEWHTFKTKPSLLQMEAIYANPRGYISFSSDEKTFLKGYIFKVSPDQKTRETEFKLLRANL